MKKRIAMTAAAAMMLAAFTSAPAFAGTMAVGRRRLVVAERRRLLSGKLLAVAGRKPGWNRGVLLF